MELVFSKIQGEVPLQGDFSAEHMIFGVSAVICAAKLKFFLRYNLAFIGALALVGRYLPSIVDTVCVVLYIICLLNLKS
ncbi:hypothetical protein P3L10_020403 [Capsicum annuum]